MAGVKTGVLTDREFSELIRAMHRCRLENGAFLASMDALWGQYASRDPEPPEHAEKLGESVSFLPEYRPR